MLVIGVALIVGLLFAAVSLLAYVANGLSAFRKEVRLVGVAIHNEVSRERLKEEAAERMASWALQHELKQREQEGRAA